MNLSATRAPGSKERRSALIVWRLLLLLLLALYFWPVSYGVTRLGTVVLVPLTWAWTWWLFGGNRWVRWFCLLTIAVALTLLALPGRTVDKDELRNAFLRELQSYEGVRYIWGGENHLGIDCSGLVRCAFLNARFKRAVCTGNGALLRGALDSWWHDVSARALQEEYRQETRKVGSAASIHQMNYEQLLPGDFAVTSDGIHVLAYLGDKVWIEADPKINRVIRLKTGDNSQWLTTPVDVMRWRLLE